MDFRSFIVCVDSETTFISATRVIWPAEVLAFASCVTILLNFVRFIWHIRDFAIDASLLRPIAALRYYMVAALTGVHFVYLTCSSTST